MLWAAGVQASSAEQRLKVEPALFIWAGNINGLLNGDDTSTFLVVIFAVV